MELYPRQNVVIVTENNYYIQYRAKNSDEAKSIMSEIKQKISNGNKFIELPSPRKPVIVTSKISHFFIEEVDPETKPKKSLLSRLFGG